MNIHVWVHDSGDREVEKKLDQVLTALAAISAKEDRMTVQLDNMTAEVTNATTVEQSAIVLIQGIAAALQAAKDDPVKIQALADSLKANDDQLAAAVAANTPAAP